MHQARTLTHACGNHVDGGHFARPELGNRRSSAWHPEPAAGAGDLGRRLGMQRDSAWTDLAWPSAPQAQRRESFDLKRTADPLDHLLADQHSRG